MRKSAIEQKQTSSPGLTHGALWASLGAPWAVNFEHLSCTGHPIFAVTISLCILFFWCTFFNKTTNAAAKRIALASRCRAEGEDAPWVQRQQPNTDFHATCKKLNFLKMCGIISTPNKIQTVTTRSQEMKAAVWADELVGRFTLELFWFFTLRKHLIGYRTSWSCFDSYAHSNSEIHTGIAQAFPEIWLYGIA